MNTKNKKTFFSLASILILFSCFFALSCCDSDAPPVQPKTYTVTFDVEGADIPSQKVVGGKKAKRPEIDPTRDSFTFRGWFVDTTELSKEFNFDGIISKDTTIYGKWTYTEYWIALQTNGGVSAIDTIKNIPARTKVQTPPANPTKTDSVFGGWYTSNTTFPSSDSFNFTTAITQNITLYARWRKDTFTVSFNVDGANFAVQKVFKGSIASAPNPAPTKADSVFDKWYINAAPQAATDTFNFNGAITQDTVVYAKFVSTTTSIIKGGVVPPVIPPTADPTDDFLKEVIAKYPPNTPFIVKHLKPGGTGDGSSWSKAAGDLRGVVNGITDAAANKVYLVLLAEGEYKTGGGLSMKNNVAIAGGFTGATDGDYSAGNTTTLSGEKQYGIIYNDDNRLDATALLYRLRIANGLSFGGGMYNFRSSPSLTNVSFADNAATGNSNGGGMYNSTNSSPTLKNVDFAGNSANNGGGMYNFRSSPTLMNVSFANNNARVNGGGMYNSDNSSPTLINVSFADNYATSSNGYGGGMYNYKASSPTLTNVSFANNNAGIEGGGMYNDNLSSPTLTNVSFANNNAGIQGGGMANSSSFPLIVNCIFWGNTVGGITASGAQIFGSSVRLYHSVIQGGIAQVSSNVLAYVGMVEIDPLLSTLANNGGFVPTLAIPDNSSAKDIGLYAKRDGATLYFSEDNSVWFNIDGSGNKIPSAAPVANAVDLTSMDARGYKRVGNPDAGAYEEGANP